LDEETVAGISTLAQWPELALASRRRGDREELDDLGAILHAIRNHEHPATSARGTVVTVMSTSAKAGKTTLVASLARALSSLTSQTVAVVDLCEQGGGAGASLAMSPCAGLMALARQLDRAEKPDLATLLAPHSAGVFLIAAAADSPASSEDTSKVISALAETVDFVIVDTPLSLDHGVIAALEASTLILILTSVPQREGGALGDD